MFNSLPLIRARAPGFFPRRDSESGILLFAEQAAIPLRGTAVPVAGSRDTLMGSSVIAALFLMISTGTLLGLVLGRSYRLPALIAASAIFALAASVGCVLAGISLVSVIILTVCGLAALQGSYLVGAAMSYAARRYAAGAQSAALRRRLARADTAPA